MQKNTDSLRFSYDASGQVTMVEHETTDETKRYYYLRNAQGDVVKLIDSSGATKVEYTYDSWGKPLSCTGTLATSLGALNPFRYRGYVYDEETGFYYLKSRYYDPETCRFISADVYLSTGQGVLGHNCFAYCGNNPIMGVDPMGAWNWGGVLTGIACVALGIACVALTVTTAGAAAPLAAGVMMAAGTAVGYSLAVTGSAMAGAAATDSVFVQDYSYTFNNHNEGLSVVLDYGNSTTECYYHSGATIEYYSCSYGAGIVYNYDGFGDYGGTFIDGSLSVQFNGAFYSAEYCFSPTPNENGEYVSATMGTVGLSIGPPVRGNGRVDYYYPIYQSEW